MTRKVVIIDDSNFIVDMLQDFFEEKLGFEVAATGTNGIQALALYRQHRPDLLAMDLNMPVKDGKVALKEILSEFPGANILIISSQVGPLLLECIRLGARGYVEKPLRLDEEEFVKELTESIDDAIRGGQPGP